jgi:glycosyltransferase involved in cell wall biosynthesis
MMARRRPIADISVVLLTGGFDRPYACGLATALVSNDVRLDVIGSHEVDCPQMHGTSRLTFLNLYGNQRQECTLAVRILRTIALYFRLFRYATVAKPEIFHILWNNKFQLLDRTLLMLYYKLRGKKIVLTAHNVNAGKRDANDSLLNRLTLKMQYRLADHIFVHTDKMKDEILEGFGVRSDAVTVVPFGINNAVPDTNLTPPEAKRRLGVGPGERTILFFGNIGPYKGLDVLITAFQRIATGNSAYRLIIAGKARGGCEKYMKKIREVISGHVSREQVIIRMEYIPDEQAEVYLKAADVLVLPYIHVYQSGVLLLAYRFGLPVIATDVGSFRNDLVVGRTGLLCRACDPDDLSRSLEMYFEGDLFKSLAIRRQEIQSYAQSRYSWDVVGKMTRDVYTALLNGGSA